MADAAGPVRGRRRGSSWVAVSHGLHRPADAGAEPVEEHRHELDAWRLVLPASGRVTHLTAALVQGGWPPPLPSALPVFAAMAEDEPRPRREGLVVSRHAEVRP